MHQKGASLISVMVAVGILGIMMQVMFSFVSQTMKVQKITKISGEKQDLKALLRGSVTCDSQCKDIRKQIPKQVGSWKIRVYCQKVMGVRISVKNTRQTNSTWQNLFPNAPRAVCAQIVTLPGATKGAPRVYCKKGKVLTGVDFASQRIECK